MPTQGSVNGRVTTREMFHELKDVERRREDKFTSRIDKLEQSITEQLDKMPTKCPYSNQVETNTKEIDNLRKRSNTLDTVNGALALVAATVAAAIGKAP